MAVAVLLAFGTPAFAEALRWQMDEIYSNHDGTIQFLELKALDSGQQFLQDHTLLTRVFATTTGTKIVTFRTTLPGDTAGRRMLVGTNSFAALGVVNPDVIVPDGFFPTAFGIVDFAEGSDAWSYGFLSDCEGRSFNRDGSGGTFARNSPTNFAGETGSVTATCYPTPIPTPTPTPTGPGGFSAPPPSIPPKRHGLWWRSPAGSENGWGLNLVHQGETLFATWFTYDADGSPTWFVMDDVRKVGEEIYFGTVYATSAAPLGAYEASRFRAQAVGVATLAFDRAGEGTFTYTVNGITERKAITKFVFDSPLPTCAAGEGPGGNHINFQDLWWRSPAGSEPGWGVNVVHQGNTLFATWFTYGTDGKPLWLVADHVARVGPNAFSGAVFRARGARFDAYDASHFSATEVGTVSFAFSDAANGTFTYTVDGVTQSKPITRYAFSSPKTTCYFP